MMDSGNDSPPSRTTILTSFLRGRPRNASQSQGPGSNNDNHVHPQELSLTPPQPPSPNSAAAHRRSRIIISNINLGSNSGTNASGVTAPNTANSTTAATTTTTSPTTTTPGLVLSNMLRRRRSGGNLANNSNGGAGNGNGSGATPAQSSNTTAANTPAAVGANPTASPPAVPSGAAHRIRLVPHIEGRRSLRFDAISRDLREGDPPIRIGRFTDRSGVGLAAINAPGSNKLAFRSKVVSRAHAELWVEAGPRFFIRDTKSSSGTFLNHTRLSPANMESRPFQMKDGDILQLGVDYQGGTEDIYKSVKIRMEIGREWQAGPNAFNTNALKNIRSLLPSKNAIPSSAPCTTSKQNTAATKASLQDCCICLFSVTIRQALFIAPCSHAFHYKCIRPYLESHHPSFSCPLCRTYADLEEDVEVDSPDLNLDDDDDIPGDLSADCGSGSGEGEPDHEVHVEDEDGVADVGAQPGTVRQTRLPPTRLRGGPREDRGAETEVEMDFSPAHPHGPSIMGATLTPGVRPGLRITTASPTRPGGALDEEAGEEAEVGEEVRLEMMDLGSVGADQDEVMLDLVHPGLRSASEGSNMSLGPAGGVPMGHGLTVVGADGVVSVGMEGVVEMSGGEAGVGGKRKR